MLPTINLLNTELVEIGTDNSSATVFSSDPSGFKLSLGAALGAPLNGSQYALPIETGQDLPPVGNFLPAESPLPEAKDLVPPTGPLVLPEQNLVPPGETTDPVGQQYFANGIRTKFFVEDVVAEEITLPDFNAVEQRDPGDELLPVGPSQDLLIDTPESGSSVVAAATAQQTLRHVSRLPGDTRGGTQLVEQAQRAIPPAIAPVSDSNTAGTTSEQPSARQIDPRVAIVNQLVPSGANDTVLPAASMNSNNIRQVVEKFDGAQRRVEAVAAKAALSAEAGVTALQAPLPVSRIVPAPVVPAAISVPVSDDGWADALNERVMWMAGKSIQKAEIRMNPAEMGPIRVEVSVTDDVATVTFNAQHALTRDAIELAIPRLREMLNENGLSLAHNGVADTDAQGGEQTSGNETRSGLPGDTGSSEEGEVTMASTLVSKSTSALVDTFV